MPTKDEPIITFRASWEMKSRIADEVLRRGLRSKGEFIRQLLEEALGSGSAGGEERRPGGSVAPRTAASASAPPRAAGAVEQALGDSSGRGSGPGLEHRPAKSEDAGSSPASPTPAEPSEEPEWKSRTRYQPRPYAPIPKGKP